MTDKTTRDTEEYLTSKDLIEGSIETPDDEEMPITIEEATVGELEAIETALNSGPDPTEFDDIEQWLAQASEEEREAMQNQLSTMRGAVDDYLVEPPLDSSEIGASKLIPLVTGMFDTWTQSDDVSDAMEDVQTEGNRSKSQRRRKRR